MFMNEKRRLNWLLTQEKQIPVCQWTIKKQHVLFLWLTSDSQADANLPGRKNLMMQAVWRVILQIDSSEKNTCQLDYFASSLKGHKLNNEHTHSQTYLYVYRLREYRHEVNDELRKWKSLLTLSSHYHNLDDYANFFK